MEKRFLRVEESGVQTVVLQYADNLTVKGLLKQVVKTFDLPNANVIKTRSGFVKKYGGTKVLALDGESEFASFMHGEVEITFLI